MFNSYLGSTFPLILSATLGVSVALEVTIIVLAIKEFISLIFIHNIRKNLTSSTVFAFITIKASQAHKTIINIIKTTQRNQTNCPKLTF